MSNFEEARALLDQINTAIASYDPVLKEKARDILLEVAFAAEDGTGESARRGGAEAAGAAARRGGGRRPRGRAAAQGAGGFKSLLDRWAPGRASEKALLGAYFLTVIEGQTPLSSQAINRLLKEHSLTVSNITRAIETNLRARPPLMEQVRKLGTTRQARKQYTITADGVRAVQEKLGVSSAEAAVA